MHLKGFATLLMLTGAMAAQESLSLSLRNAVRMALSPHGNPAIGAAAESLRTAEAQWRESRAARLPEVEASFSSQSQVFNLGALGLDQVQLPVKGYSFPKSVGPFTTIDTRIRVKQDLVNVATSRQSQAFLAGVKTAKVETDEARDAVAAQVARLYLAAVRAADAIDLAEAIRSAAESLLSETVNRAAAGKALEIDVAHARARVAAGKQRVVQAQLDKSLACFDLLAALNRDLGTPLELTDHLDDAPQETPSVARALATALSSRSEIAAQRRRVEEIRLRDRSIEAERLPSLNSFADFGTLGTSVANSVPTYNLGVALRVPVFDGGRRNARREETRSLICREEFRTEQLEKRVELEVRRALLGLDITRAQVETSAQEVEVARQELAHRRRRYQQGIDAPAEVSDAQSALAQAEDGRLAALYRWNEARVELLEAMGTIRTLAQ